MIWRFMFLQLSIFFFVVAGALMKYWDILAQSLVASARRLAVDGALNNAGVELRRRFMKRHMIKC